MASSLVPSFLLRLLFPAGRLLPLALLGLLTSAPATAQNAATAERPTPGVLRFVEDWSPLRDPQLRTSALDSLKYIPLGQGDSYLSLGGNARFLYERLENPRGPISDYYLTRLHLHADLRLTGGWRLFVQPASALEHGSEDARGIDRDDLYLLNAFVEVPLLRDEKRSLTARLGRFEMHYGDGRLITYRNPTNVRHYFEGLNLMYRQNRWNVDVFGVGFGRNRPGVFDNPVLDDPEWTWGTYARYALGGPDADDGPFGAVANDLAFFYYGHYDPRANFFNASGDEIRHTFGTHLDRQRNGWDYQFTLAGQFGRVGEQDATGLGASASAGRTWQLRDNASLRVAGLVDYWSGDRDSTDNRYQGFNPLYPRNSYYRGIAAPWSSNFYDLRPLASLTLGPVTLTTTSTWYWRASAEDGFYLGWTGSPTLAPDEITERYLGRQTEASLRYAFAPNTYLLVVYSNFSAGRFVRENPTGAEVDHFVDVFVGWAF